MNVATFTNSYVLWVTNVEALAIFRIRKNSFNVTKKFKSKLGSAVVIWHLFFLNLSHSEKLSEIKLT